MPRGTECSWKWKVGEKDEGAGGLQRAAASALLKHAPREQPDRFGFHLPFTSDESSSHHCPENSQRKRNADDLDEALLG